MTDPTAPIVPGDPVEATTRATYTAWMHHGLAVAEQLAESLGDPDAAPTWPVTESPPPECHLLSKQRTDRPEALRRAVDRGWLVHAAESATHAANGVLRGMTIAVKDIIDVAGLPTRNGTPGGLWREPESSAPAWSTLAAEGGRCIGKAATHEMAWGVVTPQIANPYDGERIAGGSSGGSAACVASGAADGALGTDTGGSIRIPAALCGVVGFRPTTGSAPAHGIIQLAPEQDVAGPIAADVDTCVTMLEVLLGRALHQSTTDLGGVRIGVLARVGPLDPSVERAYDAALTRLEGTGASLVACETPTVRQSASVSLLTMLRSSATAHADAVRDAPEAFGGEARALLTLGEHLTAYSDVIDAARLAVTTSTADLFASERLDAFLTPTTPCVAPLRGAESVTIAGRDEPVSAALTRYTGWAPVTGMPAVSVPSPSPGPPAGVQVMAPPGRDDVCARIASELNRPRSG